MKFWNLENIFEIETTFMWNIGQPLFRCRKSSQHETDTDKQNNDYDNYDQPLL
jgi:hypothetical protein